MKYYPTDPVSVVSCLMATEFREGLSSHKADNHRRGVGGVKSSHTRKARFTIHSIHGRNGIMHPDKKVGLALGILLIGFVGAFFFRNEAPDPDRDAPSLVHPTELDSRIRHQRHTPYLPDNERPAQELARVPEGLVPEVAPEIPGQSRPLNSSVVPEPIRPNAQREKIVPVPAPTRDVADSAATKPQAGGRTEKSNPGTHEVVAGETLSSISLKYLGTNCGSWKSTKPIRTCFAAPTIW